MEATQPADTFHPAEYIRDELVERGWTTDELVLIHAGGEWRDLMALNLYMCVQSPRLSMGDLPNILALGFGTSEEMWANLDAAWRKAPDRSEKVEMPDSIFGEVSRGSIVETPAP